MKTVYIIEGTDGSGKTTFSKSLAQTYGAEYKKFPSIYPQDFSKVGADFFISQMQQWVDEICVSENKTNWVVDRFFLSTLAYQGYYDQVLLDGREMLEKLIEHGYMPIIVLVSTDIDVCVKRIIERNSNEDLIDKMTEIEIRNTLKGIYFSMMKYIQHKFYYSDYDKMAWQYGYNKVRINDMEWETITLEYTWTAKELK